jgi:fructose-bisphosphate aldolase class II
MDNLLMAQPREVRERMCRRVEDFVYNILMNVFNAGGTATIAKDILLAKGSSDLGPKAERLENPDDWTREKIIERAKTLNVNQGPQGNFED